VVGKRPFPMILSPLMRLSGDNRSQETKWSSFFHLVMSHPASVRIVAAVMTSMPSIRPRSRRARYFYALFTNAADLPVSSN
jgi:hypothetical protein